MKNAFKSRQQGTYWRGNFQTNMALLCGVGVNPGADSIVESIVAEQFFIAVKRLPLTIRE